MVNYNPFDANSIWWNQVNWNPLDPNADRYQQAPAPTNTPVQYTQPAPQAITANPTNYYDWTAWNQPVNPAASPTVTNPQYSQYPSGWGVAAPTTPGWPNIAPRPDMGKTGGPASNLPPAGGKSLDTSSYDPLQAYHEALIRQSQAELAEEQYQFRNPQSQAISDYQKQQLANQQQQSAQELAYQQQQSAQELAYQQAQLAAEQQWRQQQLEAEKQQRLATLSAQPKSWLEYAALANQPPVVQPWMLPLMPQDYQQTQPVGSAISGWTPENMKGMPDLINPSAQYRARMGPTALQQYYGYQQADQGATPEESQWRLWSQGPPGGSYRGLTQQR